jgi:hypothetical protein
LLRIGPPLYHEHLREELVDGTQNFRVGTSASALNQFTTMGHDPYFN